MTKPRNPEKDTYPEPGPDGTLRVRDIDRDLGTVYTTVSSRSAGRGRYLHTDPECHYLRVSEDVMERDAAVYQDDTFVCKECEGVPIDRGIADHSMNRELRRIGESEYPSDPDTDAGSKGGEA